MHHKHESIRGDRLFYCFVDFQLSNEIRPLVYVIPAAKVADVLTLAHRKWLGTPGKKGQPHKDNKVRRLLPDYAKTWMTDNPYPTGWLTPYRDAWNVLQLDPTDPEQTISNE
jgi:hypothetical protein